MGFVETHRRWLAKVRNLVWSANPAKPVLDLRFEELESRGIVDRRAPLRNASIDALVRWVEIGT